MERLDITHSSLAPEALDRLPSEPDAPPAPISVELPSIEDPAKGLIDSLSEVPATKGGPTIAETLSTGVEEKDEGEPTIRPEGGMAGAWAREGLREVAGPLQEADAQAREEGDAFTAIAPGREEEKEDALASLDLRTETLADLYVRQGYPERARAIYGAILAEDPLHLRVRKKLVELGPPPPPENRVPASGDPTVRLKVEENIETLNRWLANIRKGVHQ